MATTTETTETTEVPTYLLTDHEQRDVRAWNAWRATHRLSDVTLSRVDLVGVALPNVDLSEVTLDRVNLSGADLTDANFFSANVYRSRFDGAECRRVSFRNANLTGVSAHGAQLASADFSHSTIIQSWFEAADLRFANITLANVICSTFGEADMTNVRCERTDWHQTRFVNTTLRGVSGLSHPTVVPATPIGDESFSDYARGMMFSAASTYGKITVWAGSGRSFKSIKKAEKYVRSLGGQYMDARLAWLKFAETRLNGAV